MFLAPTCSLLCTYQLIYSHSFMFHSPTSSLFPTNSFSHSIYPLKYILLVKFIFYIIQWSVLEKSDLRSSLSCCLPLPLSYASFCTLHRNYYSFVYHRLLNQCTCIVCRCLPTVMSHPQCYRVRIQVMDLCMTNGM